MIRRKPHTIAVALPIDRVEANQLLGHDQDAQGMVQGLMTPSTSEIVYGKFGVDVKRPWLFYCDATDADKFAEGGEVSFDGQAFSVAAAPRKYSGTGGADNCEVALSEVI